MQLQYLFYLLKFLIKFKYIIAFNLIIFEKYIKIVYDSLMNATVFFFFNLIGKFNKLRI